jgi:hypothetical protein
MTISGAKEAADWDKLKETVSWLREDLFEN